MALVITLTGITDLVKSIMETNQVSLGVQDIFYGDQERISKVPTICVEPGQKSSELSGVSRKVDITVIVYLLAYTANLNNSVQTVRRDADTLADAIESTIHQDPFLMNGGSNQNVIHSLVQSIESGYARRGGTTFRTSRIAIEARSQAILPGLAGP